MKRNHIAFVVLASMAPLHGSTVIYYDDFGNADDFGSTLGLDGDAPTIAASIYGGSSSATWASTNQWASDGNKSFGTANAFLPVSIPSNTQGEIYMLTVDVSVAASAGEDWIAAGFASTTSGVFWDLGAPWMFMRGKTTAGGGSGINASANTVGAFSRNEENGASLPLGSPNELGPYSGTFQIVLDTTSAFWTVAWYFREIGGEFQEFHNYEFSASDPNPNITHIGLGAVNNGVGAVDNFRLEVVPEPSALALASLGLAVFLRRKRVS